MYFSVDAVRFHAGGGVDAVTPKIIDKLLFADNTGYDRPTAELLLSKMGWSAGVEYDVLVTATDVNRGRPHPDMILLAMEQTGINDPALVAKVGDSAIDILEGKNAGCGFTAGVTTGAQTAKQLWRAEPDAVVDELEALLTASHLS